MKCTRYIRQTRRVIVQRLDEEQFQRGNPDK